MLMFPAGEGVDVATLGKTILFRRDEQAKIYQEENVSLLGMFVRGNYDLRLLS